MSLRKKYSCQYPGCDSSYLWRKGEKVKNKHFFKFPSDETTCAVWKNICGIDDTENCRNRSICEDHFELKDYVNFRKHALNPYTFPKDKQEVLKLNSESASLIEGGTLEHEQCLRSLQPWIAPDALNAASMLSGNVNENHIGGDISGRVTKIAVSNISSELCSNNKFSELCIDNLIMTEENEEAEEEFVQIETSLANDGSFSCMNDHSYCIQDTLLCDTNESITHSDNVDSIMTQTTSVKRKSGFLTEAGVTLKTMTPREKIMYKIHRKASSRISKLQKKLQTQKTIFKELKDRYDRKVFEYVNDQLSEVATNFINSQLRNVERPALARRWTEQDKTFALSLYKRSPQIYRYFSNYFYLPTSRTLKGLLSKIPFEPGLNKLLLEQLKIKIDEMNVLDRCCSLIFGEMSLGNNCYEDLELNQPPVESVNHTLVIMINGLKKTWNQVVAYYLTNHAIDDNDFKVIIKSVIFELNQIGVRVKAVVCGRNFTLRRALVDICQESQVNPNSFTFDINNEMIVVIHNASHLLESTLNALLNYNILFSNDKVAKFEHIKEAFYIDKSRQFRQLRKLQDSDFNFIQTPVNVKFASCCLSTNVAAAINSMTASGMMLNEALDTATFVQLISDLFDSLNCHAEFSDDDNTYSSLVKVNSPHLEFWNKTLSDMKFWKLIDVQTESDVTNSSVFIDSWINTIKAVKYLWQQLQKIGYKSLNLRNLNQSPVEDLFSQIRHCTGKSSNPSQYQFKSALKTIVFKDLILPLSKGTNCDDVIDYNENGNIQDD